MPPRRTENREQRTERAGAKRQTFHGHGAPGKRATGEAPCKIKPQRRNACRKGGALTPGARSCALPRPTFLRPRNLKDGPSAKTMGGRERSAAKPQSDRWSPKRFAPPLRLCGSQHSFKVKKEARRVSSKTERPCGATDESPGKRQGAKRRAAGAISGRLARKAPDGARSGSRPPCVFAVHCTVSR